MLNFCLLGHIGIAFLDKSVELYTLIIVVCFKFVLSTSEFKDSLLIIDLDKAIRTRNIGIEHEDHIESIGFNLFGLRIPEHTRIVWLTLL